MENIVSEESRKWKVKCDLEEKNDWHWYSAINYPIQSSFSKFNFILYFVY